MAEINWAFEEHELTSIQKIVDNFDKNPFVKDRIKRNIEKPPPEVTRDRIWRSHLVAQLTSQQRVGPDTPVSRFLREEIATVDLQRCLESRDVSGLLASTLQKYGGIRFYSKIGEACDRNLCLLERDGGRGWKELEERLQKLKELRQREPVARDFREERQVCRFLYEGIGGEGFHRIGPKQSRNLLQVMGLTRYETPLDSRVTMWINENIDIPYYLTAGGLSDPGFYDFNMDLVQEACREAGILPCVFDAAVFTSFSPDWVPDDEDTIL